MTKWFAKEEYVSPYKKAFCLVVMAIALMVILISNRPMLNHAQVEFQLNGFKEYVNTRFKESGSNIVFAYKEIAVKNLGESALIDHPTITISDSDTPEVPRTTISTDRIIMLPVREEDARFVVQFPDPITVVDAMGVATRLTFEGGVPAYSFITRQEENGGIVMRSKLRLPPKMLLAMGKAVPSGDPAVQPSGTVSYAPDPVISFTSYSDGRNDAALSFQNIIIGNGQGKTVLTVGGWNLTKRDDAPKDGRIPFASMLSLADITLKTEETPQSPYTFKLNISGTKAFTTQPDAKVVDLDMDVHDMSLSNEKFTIIANGAISRKPDDALPYGKMEIKIAHFPAMVDSIAITPEMKALVVEVFNRITGEDTTNSEEVQFTAQREKLGVSAIGKASFEDIAMIVLPRFMANKSAEPQADGAPGVAVTPESEQRAHTPEANSAPAPVSGAVAPVPNPAAVTPPPASSATPVPIIAPTAPAPATSVAPGTMPPPQAAPAPAASPAPVPPVSAPATIQPGAAIPAPAPLAPITPPPQ